jgi:hypothetical protein
LPWRWAAPNKVKSLPYTGIVARKHVSKRKHPMFFMREIIMQCLL